MRLLINGEERLLDGPKTLREVLSCLQINPETVVVEHNQEVVRRGDLASVAVKDQDRVEIVHFVGGGRRPKNLVIVESPAKAKTINKFLGDDFQVEASMGHVRDLPRSKMGIDIDQNFSPQYVVIRKALKTVKHLKKQAEGKEGIYLAPDPDREGEAISWHLEHLLKEGGNSVPVHRVVFNEITQEAVRQAFHHPRKIKMNLVEAQQARRILDRIVGYELSPLLWRKVGRGLSAGRVQSVALRLIVEREREIKNFVPREYWSLVAKLSSERGEQEGKIFLARLERIGKEKAHLKNREQTEKLRSEILKLPFRVEKVERRERSRQPQAPYTTSKLQQEGYNRLGFSAAKTMRVAQMLYEGVELGQEGSVGLITYMRTDSVHVASSAQREAANFIRAKFGEKFLPPRPPIYRSKKGAQEAHEAIRPTSVKRDPEAVKPYLSEEAFKLYELIWRKFVASQMTPALDEHISVSILAGDRYFFKATGRRNLFPGFTAVLEELKTVKSRQKEGSKKKAEEEEDEEEMMTAELPYLEANDPLRLHELEGRQHFTKPPGRYNDASLVKTLEENGIGRPSTYAPTLYTLLAREYVQRASGALVPTELGEIVADLLVKHFPKVMDVEFTATMEGELDKIEDGELEWVKVLQDFYGPFQSHLAAAREEMKNVRREATPTDYVCDLCGKPVVIKWGRFGKFMACSGFPACKYTRSMPTGVFCPEPGCGGELVKRKSKNRRTFYGCSHYPKCNYVASKLPKTASGDEELPEADREALEP